MSENAELLRMLELEPNSFLKKSARCYYVLDYLRHGTPGNPQFILHMKNTFNTVDPGVLQAAKQRTMDILKHHIPYVMKREEMRRCTLVCIPRAKAADSYTPQQMYLRDSVAEAIPAINENLRPRWAGLCVKKGADIIIRHTNTRTTHLKEEVKRVTADWHREENDGRIPYPGITKETCHIDAGRVKGCNIILVDDIYTAGVNIDEDCIQALYDLGAAKVVLFTLSRTVPHGEMS